MVAAAAAVATAAVAEAGAYVVRLQALLFNEFGVAANDLADGDDGYEGRGVRRRQATRRKGMGKLIKYLGYEWYQNQEFEIDCLLDEMVADGGEVPGRSDIPAGTKLYLVLWKGFPPDIATWEDADGLPVTAIAEYQGAVLPDPEEFDESDVSDDDESMEYSPGP